MTPEARTWAIEDGDTKIAQAFLASVERERAGYSEHEYRGRVAEARANASIASARLDAARRRAIAAGVTDQQFRAACDLCEVAS